MANHPSELRRLDSWKEIAAYLGRDVTTAIRWGKERGLPVHRVPGGKLARVFAYASELDEWLQRSTDSAPVIDAVAAIEQSQPRLSRAHSWTAGLTAGVFAVGCAVAFAAWGSASGATEVSVAGNALNAIDPAGRHVWSHTFKNMRAGAAPRLWSIDAPLATNEPPDFVAAIDLMKDAGNVPVSTLHRFSRTGRLLWSHAPADRIVFRAGEYGPPWANWHLAAYRAGTEPRVAWSTHHYTWWPGLLLSFDANGRRTGTYVNAGWIAAAAGIPGGKHLAVVGMSNATQSYFLAILDAAHPSGSSPEPLGHETACLSCPKGRPLHYFVFPRSDVASQFAYPTDPPAIAVLDDGSLRVQVMETPGPDIGSTVYEFDPEFRIRGIRTSDAFDVWHARLEASGALTHGVAACPDRRGRAVRRWTPASGWIE